MRQLPERRGLLAERGLAFRFEEFVTAVAFTRDGSIGAFALADGSLQIFDPARPDETRRLNAHEGGALTLIQDSVPGALLSGGDDGRLLRIQPGAAEERTELGQWRGKWLERIALNERQRILAVPIGKRVELINRDGAVVQSLEHDSTASGAAFDPSGQRLAVSHYGGVTLWISYRDGWKPTLLGWKGSHLGVTWSPSGKFIVSTMQENALHGWRLADKKDMAMRGYPAKVHSMSWTLKGRYLATAGAESAVLWPFKTDDGPMGKQPLTVGLGESLATVVAAHPGQNLVAIGYKDGSVLLGRVEEGDHVVVRPAEGQAVSALAWSPDGKVLAIGAEDGFAAVLGLGRPA